MKRFVVFMAAVPLAQHAIPQEPPTFSTRTNLVIVDVAVADRNGKPVENLTKDDFELYEDGKLQQLQGCDIQRLDTKGLPALNESSRPPGQVRSCPRPQQLAWRVITD